MKRSRWPIVLALLMLCGVARPAMAAATTLTIEQMEELLITLRGKPDGKVSGELHNLQLSERVSAARLARWEGEFTGTRTHEQLMKLADASAFLDPPAPDLDRAPRPDVKTQLQILKQAVEYVGNTITRLPDFYATRVTTHFENTPSPPANTVGGVSAELHPAGTYNRMVTYRDGQEVLYEKGSKMKEEPALALTTSGEFGPILDVVIEDALHGRVRWQDWEQGPDGPLAVFAYAVTQPDSHFQVGIAGRGGAKELLPAYHGEITIDPATGAILRLSQIADMVAPHADMLAEIAVDYAPVTIAGRSYICPVRGVALSQFPIPSGLGIYADPETQSTRSIKSELNDVAFTNYHEFRAEVRIVTNPGASGDSNDPSANAAAAPEAPGNPAQPAGGATVAATLATAPAAAASPAGEQAAEAPSNAPAVPKAETQAAESPNASLAAKAAPAPSADATPANEAAENPPTSNVNETSDVAAGKTVLHAQSKLVLVDVVVTDHGRPVKSLDRSRFHVFEDGHEQNIASFEENVPEGAPAVVHAPALPPDTYTNVPAYPKSGAVNVLLLDGLNTEAADQMYVRREMIRFLKTMPAGEDIAIFTLGAKLRLIQGFTQDTAKLLATLAEKKSAAPASLRQSAEQKTEDQQTLDQMTDAEVSAQDIANTQDFFNDAEMQQTSLRIDMTFEALQELARYLSGIPGRKNVVWFSSSFPLQFFAIGSDPIKQIALNAGMQASQQVRDTADLLAAERIALYPVDARGVIRQSMFDPTVQAQNYGRTTMPARVGGGPNRFSQDTQLNALQTDTEHSSMDVLAEETGGRAVHDSNGLKQALADALSDGSNFYSITYVPPERKSGQNGVLFRSIEVKIDGAKYKLAYRRGYYTDDTAKPEESNGRIPEVMAKAAVFGAPPSTEIVFQARVLPEGTQTTGAAGPDKDVAGERSTSFPEGTRRYDVQLNVPLGQLTIAEGSGGAALEQIQCALVAYDADGELVNSAGRAFHFNLSAEQYQKTIAQGGTISAHLALDLPMRDVFLRIVVHDPASTKTGSIEIPVQGVDK
ncbi:MAG TPA: VWA domain-containing protein [Terracidiphilus sp.]|nr:VWA domain-containing protein [Terracidiphilus sp.]